jgi:hypothetical protein
MTVRGIAADVLMGILNQNPSHTAYKTRQIGQRVGAD